MKIKTLIAITVFCSFAITGCDDAGKSNTAVIEKLNAKLQSDAEKAARDQAALDQLTKIRPTPPLSQPTGWEFKR